MTMALALPVTARVVETNRGRQAAAFVAARLRSRCSRPPRSRPIGRARVRRLGVRLDVPRLRGREPQWAPAVGVAAGTGSMRRRPVRRRVDVPRRAASRWTARSAGLRANRLRQTRFASGVGNLASFSPAGSGTAGSRVPAHRRGGQHYLVRVGGVTGRVRVLRGTIPSPAAGTRCDHQPRTRRPRRQRPRRRRELTVSLEGLCRLRPGHPVVDHLPSGRRPAR